MPAFWMTPTQQDIKNFQMSDHEPKKSSLAVERCGSQELLSGQFRDFDEFSAAAADWDLDFVQLDAGPAPVALTQISTPDLLIQRFRFGRTYLQRGSSSPTMRTFGFAEPNTHYGRVFGDDLTVSDLALFRMGGEFEAVSPPDFSCVAISIDAARLDEAFAAIEMRCPSSCQSTECGLLRVDPNLLQRMGSRATQTLDTLNADPGALNRSELLEDLNFQLPIDLALAIQSADDAPRLPISRIRDLALRRALAFIEDHLDEPITIRSLCEEVGVGWTTLVHVFREHFGVTPKAYLRAVRLNCARRDLLDAARETPIADVANRWGFWHMGQFAADYRRLFGELPSDTKSCRGTRTSDSHKNAIPNA
jgi:AraC family ethanolamine operon transcriptional activator